jgi:hypothetical protein
VRRDMNTLEEDNGDHERGFEEEIGVEWMDMAQGRRMYSANYAPVTQYGNIRPSQSRWNRLL